jgi:peptidyl-prolyl cis-trans isomerase B (cyclophilin B)
LKQGKEAIDREIKVLDFNKYDYRLNISTNMGPIRLSFFPDVAPGHCANMIALAQIGFYNGLSFHRIIPGFVIQGGCPKGDGSGGPGYQIKAEFNERKHVKGTLSMARSQNPDSAGCQFFICLAEVPYLDNQYTVFGEIMDDESLSTLDKISVAPTNAQDRPVEPIVMKEVKVIRSAI